MALGTDLQYSIDNMDANIQKIDSLKTDFETTQKDFIALFQDMRTDWVGQGSVEFFNLVDVNWNEGMNACITMLNDLKTALTEARNTYATIETETPNYLNFPQ